MKCPYGLHTYRKTLLLRYRVSLHSVRAGSRFDMTQDPGISGRGLWHQNESSPHRMQRSNTVKCYVDGREEIQHVIAHIC